MRIFRVSFRSREACGQIPTRRNLVGSCLLILMLLLLKNLLLATSSPALDYSQDFSFSYDFGFTDSLNRISDELNNNGFFETSSVPFPFIGSSDLDSVVYTKESQDFVSVQSTVWKTSTSSKVFIHTETIKHKHATPSVGRAYKKTNKSTTKHEKKLQVEENKGTRLFETSSVAFPFIEANDKDSVIDTKESLDRFPVSNPVRQTSTPSEVLSHSDTRRFQHSTPSAEYFKHTTPSAGNFKHTTPSAGQFKHTTPSAGHFKNTTPSAGHFKHTTSSAGHFKHTPTAEHALKKTKKSPTKNKKEVQEKEIQDTRLFETSSIAFPFIEANDKDSVIDTKESLVRFPVSNPVKQTSTPSEVLSHSDTRRFKHSTPSAEYFKHTTLFVGNFKHTTPSAEQSKHTTPSAGHFKHTTSSAGHFKHTPTAEHALKKTKKSTKNKKEVQEKENQDTRLFETSSVAFPFIEANDKDSVIDTKESLDRFPVSNSVRQISTPSEVLSHSDTRRFKHSTPSAEYFKHTTPSAGNFKHTTPSAGQFKHTTLSAGHFKHTTPSAGHFKHTTPSAGHFKHTPTAEHTLKKTKKSPTKNKKEVQEKEIQDTRFFGTSSVEIPFIEANNLDSVIDTKESLDLFSVQYPVRETSTPKALTHSETRKIKHTTHSARHHKKTKKSSTKHEKKVQLEEIKDTRKGFAVWSKYCQIPDLDPWHPTILHLVSESPPLDCSEEYPALSSTKEVRHSSFDEIQTAIYLDPNLASNMTDASCCFHSVIREDDNTVEDGSECYALDFSGNYVLLSAEEEEFVRVLCWKENRTKPFYTNYHVSVPKKKDVEGRLASLPKASGTSYNVLVIGLDSMSRLNAHRQVPMTLDYFIKHLGAVEMKGFQKVGDNTFPNLFAMLTGYSEDEQQDHCWGNLNVSYNDCPWVWDRFSSVGYRTLYGEDSSSISTFNYFKPGFHSPPTDYYSRPFMKALEDELGWNKVGNCYLCLGPQSQIEVLLDWSRTFLHKFSSSPYFGFVWMNSMSHDFLNTASAIDLLLLDFFRDLKEGGHLDNTVLLLMGDHGLRWGDIVETYVGRLEERLPLLAISLPEELQRQHPDWAQNLKYNSRRLVTPFDLHSTLLDLLPDHRNSSFHVNGSWAKPQGPGLTLFTPLPVNRTCEDAKVAGQWCTCQESKDVANSDSEVTHVVKFVVKHLNRVLSSWPACSPLKLDSVSSARLRSPLKTLESNDTSTHVFDYSTTFKTLPGGAVLDATVRFVPQNHTHELLGEVSRLNLYGNQSWCVRDTKVKKYCYCIRQLNKTTDQSNSRR